MILKRPVHIPILALLGIVLMWLFFSASDPPADIELSTEAFPEREFDYYMVRFETTRFTPGAARHFHLNSERLTHFPAPDEHAILEQPRITFYGEQEEDAPWRIRSESARVEGPGAEVERIDFQGDVVVTQQQEDGGELNIYTDFLSVYPEPRMASTDAPVLVTSPGSEMRSTGMQADLANNHISLLADVRGFYE